MELFIEKDFLDNFYLDYDEATASKGQQVVASILKEYPEVDWYLDVIYDDLEGLESLKQQNPFILFRSVITPPIPVENLKEYAFKYSSFRQTIFLTAGKREWFEEAFHKGALCLNFEDYEEIIEKMTEECHLKIDLSEKFDGWNHFEFLKILPISEMVLNDSYCLVDKRNQSMAKNIIPLLGKVVENRAEPTKITIFTKEFQENKRGKAFIIKEVTQKHQTLNRALANSRKKIRIVNNAIGVSSYDLHDRVMIGNFFTIDSGKGFNLIPHKESNSQIITATIFEKYTYKRIKNLFKIYDKYLDKLNSDGFSTSEFTKYPV